MYYTAVVTCDRERWKLQQVADQYGIELKVFTTHSPSAGCLLDNLADRFPWMVIELPFVLAGYEIIGQGEHAWLDLYNHHLANPHVHWEADQGEDAI